MDFFHVGSFRTYQLCATVCAEGEAAHLSSKLRNIGGKEGEVEDKQSRGGERLSRLVAGPSVPDCLSEVENVS